MQLFFLHKSRLDDNEPFIFQLQAAREEELTQMADRPFSSKIVYLDMSGEAFRPGAANIPFNVSHM